MEQIPKYVLFDTEEGRVIFMANYIDSMITELRSMVHKNMLMQLAEGGIAWMKREREHEKKINELKQRIKTK